MRKEEIINYIKQFLNKLEIEEEKNEIQNSILLLVVYMAGLMKQPFPLDKVGKNLEIEEEIPAQFHISVAKLAIKKSKIEQRTDDIRIIGVINKELSKELDIFREFIKKLSP